MIRLQAVEVQEKRQVDLIVSAMRFTLMIAKSLFSWIRVSGNPSRPRIQAIQALKPSGTRLQGDIAGLNSLLASITCVQAWVSKRRLQSDSA